MTPVPSAGPHETCAPGPSSAPLPFFGHSPGPQCPSCSEGPRSELQDLNCSLSSVYDYCPGPAGHYCCCKLLQAWYAGTLLLGAITTLAMKARK